MVNADRLKSTIEAAVQADRARIYSELSTLVWQQDEYWREDSQKPHQRAYALGSFAGLLKAARAVDPEVPTLLPSYWQSECDKLGL